MYSRWHRWWDNQATRTGHFNIRDNPQQFIFADYARVIRRSAIMDVDTPQKEKQKINDADIILQQYINHIRAKQCGLRNLTIGRWPRINSRLIGHLFLKYLVKDTPFRVNNDKCIKCGRCSSLCPVHDIKGGVGTNRNGCTTAMSHMLLMLPSLPYKAISFGSATRNKGQYWYGHKKNLTLKQPNQK